MQFTTTVYFALLTLAAAQEITLTGPAPPGESLIPTATIPNIGSGASSFLNSVSSDIASQASDISSDLATATGGAAQSLSTALNSLSSAARSASSAATSSTPNPAPIQTAAVGLGALFGGVAALANL